jgi:hypothetical protein
MLCRAEEGGAGEEERRRDEGTGEGAKGRRRSLESRREGGTRERGKGRRRSLRLLVVRQQELG